MDAYEAHALLKVHPGPAVHRKVFLISADGMRQRVRRENGNEIEKKVAKIFCYGNRQCCRSW
jgi:hypothetical protein